MDYAALAKQFGGTTTPAPTGSVDYSALAKQFGGTTAQPPAAKPGADHPFNPNNPDYQKNVNAITKGSSQNTLLNFLQALPASAADTILGTSARTIASVSEIPHTLKTGQATQKTYNIPGISPFKSIQSDAANTFNDVIEGNQPLIAGLKPVAESVVGPIDTAATAKGLAQGAKGLFKAIPALIDKVDVRAGGEAAQKGLNKLSDNATKDALKVTRPLVDKKSSITALENAGKPGGVGANLQTTASSRDLQVADSVKGIVKPNVSAAANNAAINQEISRISEQEIKPFLDKNPAPFNQKTLSAYLDKSVSIPNYIKADPVLENTYNLTKQSLMDEVAKFPKTTNGLWEARKSFDQVAENQIGKLNPQSEKVSAVKQAILDFRRAANDFIAERTPGGDAEFKAKLKDLSNKYAARTNIAENNYKLVNKGFFERFKTQHPTATKVIKGAAKVAGVGAALDEAGKLLH
jgi:hypothetical protein